MSYLCVFFLHLIIAYHVLVLISTGLITFLEGPSTSTPFGTRCLRVNPVPELRVRIKEYADFKVNCPSETGFQEGKFGWSFDGGLTFAMARQISSGIAFGSWSSSFPTPGIQQSLQNPVLCPFLIVQERFLSIRYQMLEIAFQALEEFCLTEIEGGPKGPQLYLNLIILTQCLSGLLTRCQANLTM